MARTLALVTPSVMKWAREKAGYSVAEAARKIGRPEQEIAQWEEGTLPPSLPQARRAAEVYKRSVAVFYLPEPPRDFDTLRDFRHLPQYMSREYSPELALLIRRLRMRQEWLREFLIAQDGEEFPFLGTASTRTPSGDVAKAIRDALGISLLKHTSYSDRREALNLWIDGAESTGICVCRQGMIDCEEARGFVLADSHAPFVYVNSSDALAAQLFTLVHELVHLWINEPGISNLEGLDLDEASSELRIERFCNRVASETLLDDQMLDEQMRLPCRPFELAEMIDQASSKLTVSGEVIARRLLDRGLISSSRYGNLRDAFQKRWVDYRQKRRRGGGNYYSTKVASNSRTFTRTVFGAYRGGALSLRDAAGLLDVKANNLDRLVLHAAPLLPRRVG